MEQLNQLSKVWHLVYLRLIKLFLDLLWFHTNAGDANFRDLLLLLNLLLFFDFFLLFDRLFDFRLGEADVWEPILKQLFELWGLIQYSFGVFSYFLDLCVAHLCALAIPVIFTYQE